MGDKSGNLVNLSILYEDSSISNFVIEDVANSLNLSLTIFVTTNDNVNPLHLGNTAKVLQSEVMVLSGIIHNGYIRGVYTTYPGQTEQGFFNIIQSVDDPKHF
jgi:hypothetical protein